MEISHWCFLCCGRLRVRVGGLLRSVLEVVGKEWRPRLYCSLILMSSASGQLGKGRELSTGRFWLERFCDWLLLM